MNNQLTYSFESQIVFGCTALKDKKGIIKPDADGYYSIILGAFNVRNSYNAFYPFDSCKQLFEDSSHLMRRINAGCLKGEMGHPRRERGMTDREWMGRVIDVRETNVAFHIRKIVLDDNNGANKGLVTVIGEVKPSGPMGPALKESLENRFEDVCFSIRSLTNDEIVNNVHVKHIFEIITWDVVLEPGIKNARKYQSPGLESLIQTPFSSSTIEEMISEKESAISMESNNRLILENVYNKIKSNRRNEPRYINW